MSYPITDYRNWNKPGGSPILPPPPRGVPAPDDKTTITGQTVDSKITYGKVMPLLVLGLARIGGTIIFGPYLSNGACSFAVSFGVPANVAGTRALYEIALDSSVAWQSAVGVTSSATPSSGFKSEPFTFRFYNGTLTQAADPLETANFGLEAVAYRPQIVIFFENLPLAAFNNKIPFVAAVLGDITGGADPSDGITLGQAFERVAYSPWARYTTSSFDASGVDDVIGAMLIGDDITFLELMRRNQRIYRNLDIVQRDKLMALDRGSTVDADITLDLDRIEMEDRPVIFTRESHGDALRELELETIDAAADYTFLPSKAQRPRDPVPITTSVKKETVTLPIVLDASTRMSMVTYALHYDAQARKKVQLKTLAYGYEIEPGDLIALSGLGDGFETEVFKVTETLHGADYSVQINAQAILKCNLPSDPEHSLNYYEQGGVKSVYTLFIDLGTPAEDRLIVVVASCYKGIPPVRTVTACTINGVAATSIFGTSIGGTGIDDAANCAMAVFSLLVPTGTTATMQITTSGSVECVGAGVYILTGLASTTPQDTASSATNGTNPSTTIDVPSNGVVIAGYAGQTDGGSVVWTGLNTLRYNQSVPLIGSWAAGASQGSMASQTARPISVTAPATGPEILMVVAFA